MKKYKTIRNGMLALIAASIILSGFFPVVTADSADISQLTHSYDQFHLYISTQIFAQSFTPTMNDLNYVVLYLNKTAGAFTGSVTLEISSSRTGPVLTSYAIPLSAISTAPGGHLMPFNFTDISITPGNTYWIRLFLTDTNAPDYVTWFASPTNSGSSGVGDCWLYDGSNWVERTNNDFAFVTYGSNQDPVAVIERSEPVGLTVDFDASSSYDLDGTITTYQWDFTNDGSWDYIGMTVSYTYPSAGPYTCKLRVIDNDGAWGDDTDSFTLSDGGANEDPVASFTYSTNGLTVSVDGSGSSDSDGTITGYQWDWTTDGSYDNTGETQSHTYSANGTYNVTLRVMDNGSATNTTMHQVTVTTGGGSSSGFATDNTMTYLIIGVVAAIAIGAVVYYGPTMKKGGRKKK
ncbi:MAG: PKD domain-containing protein [Candidatus Thorarchaeota archaeon]